MKTKMTRDIVPEGFTMRLALVDALPVIFYAGSMILIGQRSWGIALPDWRHGESSVEGHSRAEEEKCLAAICSNADPYAARVPAYDLFAICKCRSNQF